jgi:hypothetical protein
MKNKFLGLRRVQEEALLNDTAFKQQNITQKCDYKFYQKTKK